MRLVWRVVSSGFTLVAASWHSGAAPHFEVDGPGKRHLGPALPGGRSRKDRPWQPRGHSRSLVLAELPDAFEEGSDSEQPPELAVGDAATGAPDPAEADAEAALRDAEGLATPAAGTAAANPQVSVEDDTTAEEAPVKVARITPALASEVASEWDDEPVAHVGARVADDTPAARPRDRGTVEARGGAGAGSSGAGKPEHAHPWTAVAPITDLPTRPMPDVGARTLAHVESHSEVDLSHSTAVAFDGHAAGTEVRKASEAGSNSTSLTANGAKANSSSAFPPGPAAADLAQQPLGASTARGTSTRRNLTVAAGARVDSQVTSSSTHPLGPPVASLSADAIAAAAPPAAPAAAPPPKDDVSTTTASGADPASEDPEDGSHEKEEPATSGTPPNATRPESSNSTEKGADKANTTSEEGPDDNSSLASPGLKPASDNATADGGEGKKAAAITSGDKVDKVSPEDRAEDAKDAEAEKEVDAELKNADAEDQVQEGKRRAEATDGLKFRPGEEDTLHRVERLEGRIEEETKSQALAEMLGGMKMDMYMLREKINMLDKEVADGVKLEPEDPADSLVYPVSVCMQCILWLTAQYLFVFTGAAVCRGFAECFELGHGTIAEMAMRGACDTLFYAPMLCVLFLGAQLRAMQISQGVSGPPPAAELGMQACAWSILVQTLIVLAVPVFSGQAADIGDHGVKFDALESKAVAGLLTFLRYIAMMMLCIGIAVVCFMIYFMDTRTLGVEPVDLWDDPTSAETEYAPQISVAMRCTIALTFLFFFVYILHAVLQSILELSRGAMLPESVHESVARTWVNQWEQCLKVCAHATDLAPMVCILFMAARIRALELDDRDGKPQWWAELCFYVCEAAIFVHVGVVLLAKSMGWDPNVSPNVANALARGMSRPALDESEDFGGMHALGEANHNEKVVVGFRGVLMLVAYMATIGIVVSLFTMHHPSKPMEPLSPAMWCAVSLACMYLTVYLGLFVAQVLSMLIFHFSTMTHGTIQRLRRLIEVFLMAESTVKLCPMIAILCIGTRTRALQLSDFKGSPQCWAQDAMYVASAALCAQLLTVFVGSCLSSQVLPGTPRQGLGLGREGAGAGSMTVGSMTYIPGRFFLNIFRALTFVALYGGVLTIGASVLTIRPETAGCERRGYYNPLQ